MALRLRYDINDLQTALDGQLEALGTLVLTHRPPTVQVAAQIAEVAQIQDELSVKQTTLDSLRQAKGGKSVIRQVNEEVAQLQACRKALTRAVGQEAYRVRAEMPGTAGCYAAMDRLQPLLEAKQSELKAIEDQIGPVWPGTGGNLLAMKRPLMIAGAAIGGLLLLCLLWKIFPAATPGDGLLGSEQKTIDSIPLAIDFDPHSGDDSLAHELAKQAMELWKPIRLGESYYVYRIYSPPWNTKGGTIYIHEYRKPSIRVRCHIATEADKLNGLKDQASVSLVAESTRIYVVSAPESHRNWYAQTARQENHIGLGRWSDWVNYWPDRVDADGGIVFNAVRAEAKKTNGRWRLEEQSSDNHYERASQFDIPK